eukprot:scaffold5021_cov123-Isochrysis_galbana.AAC.10
MWRRVCVTWCAVCSGSGPQCAVSCIVCSVPIAGSPNWEGTGKIFCLREDLRQELRRFQGRAPAWLMGAWYARCTAVRCLYHLYALVALGRR